MLTNKFVATTIRSVGFNSYVTDLLEVIISTACENEEEETPLLVLLGMQHSGDYYYLDNYIKVPEADDADEVILMYEAAAFNAIYKILKEQDDLIELLCDCYKNNIPVQILGLPQGIWVEIHG